MLSQTNLHFTKHQPIYTHKKATMWQESFGLKHTSTCYNPKCFLSQQGNPWLEKWITSKTCSLLVWYIQCKQVPWNLSIKTAKLSTIHLTHWDKWKFFPPKIEDILQTKWHWMKTWVQCTSNDWSAATRYWGKWRRTISVFQLWCAHWSEFSSVQVCWCRTLT